MWGVVKYEIRYNKRNKRYVVFEVLKSGRWRIKEGFKTRTEANAWVKKRK